MDETIKGVKIGFGLTGSILHDKKGACRYG